MQTRRSHTVLLTTLLVLIPALKALAEEALVFSPGDIIKWQTESFHGRTQYQLVEVDGREAVHAECSNSASGLWLREKIDLDKYPIVEWQWRVDETFDNIDETRRAGDDYPARLYVILDGGLLLWRTRAINYVWASEMPAGTDWPNAYTRQARMVAVRSGPPAQAGTWFTERRNLRDDFKRLHDRSPTAIDALAIMTDCDDTNSTAQAWYGDIRFLPEQAVSEQP